MNRAQAELAGFVAAAHRLEVRRLLEYRETLLVVLEDGQVFVAATADDGDPFVFADGPGTEPNLYRNVSAAMMVVDALQGGRRQ